MNGNGYRKPSFSSNSDPDLHAGSSLYDAVQSRPPPAKALLEGSKDASFSSKSRMLNHGHSAPLNTSDPVTMHLLVETAIGDSQEYEVLSFEEIDELKREALALANRIDALRRKLALESKVRDAATSLNRLYARKSDGSEASPKRHRRSFLGSKGSGGEMLEKTDDELAASNRKCEELSTELWKLEKRLTEVQKRLLQHTAGVLQMTHRANTKKSNMNGVDRSERPVSSGSGPSHSHESVQMLDDHDEWDDRSQYRTLDEFSDVFDGRSKSRSPVRHDLAHQDTQFFVENQRKLQELNQKLRNLILHSNPQQDRSIGQPPGQTSNGLLTPTANPLHEHFEYLDHGLDTVEAELQHSSSKQDTSEPALRNLWSELQRRNVEAKARKRQMRQNRSPDGVDSDNSPDEDGNDEEEYSLHSFSSKVQWLQRRTFALSEQKAILRRQIKQQREINSKSDSDRDSEIEKLKGLLRETDEEATKAREEVVVVMDRLETFQNQQKSKETSDLAAFQDQSKELERLQKDLQLVREQTKNQIHSLEEELKAIKDSKAQSDSAEAQMKTSVFKKEAEIGELEQQVARLQTEVTVARAELEGAYGTRAQRAAEVASNPAVQREMDDLTTRNSSLEKDIAAAKDRMRNLETELKETISEYEVMTKQSIEFEKERENLEQAIDSLRDKLEVAESQLSEEKLKWLGSKSAGAKDGNGPSESTSTMVMRNEFKKMMRDTRAEHVKALKAEQEDRRKLEAMVRSLKGNQTPVKS